MAGNIKGITIEFNGDTSKLDKSIKEIDKNTKDLDKELRNVDKALKFNPTSVELWTQKQDILKGKITDTTSKLKLLKEQQKQMDAKGVDKNSEQYRKLKREIVETESKLKHFKGELIKLGSAKLTALGNQFKQVGNKISAAGRSLQTMSRYAAVFTGAVAAMTVKSAQYADKLNTLQKQYHINTQELQKYDATAQLVDVDTETILKAHTKLTKSMSSAAEGTGKQAEAFEKLGINVKNADGSFKDADTVFQETISALSKVTDETERDALAMTLMGKSAQELNPLIEDGGETYKRVAEVMKKYGLDFIDQETLDKANEFNDQLDTIKAIGLVALQQLGMALSAYILPAAKKAVDLFGNFAGWLSKLDPKILAIVTGIAGALAVLSPLLIVIGMVTSAIGTIISAIGSMGAAIGGVAAAATGPIGLIVAAVVALVAIFAAAYAKSEAFRNAINGLVTQLVDMLKPVLEEIIKVLQQLFTEIVATAVEIADQLAPVIEQLMPVLKVLAQIIIGVLMVAFKMFIAQIKLMIKTVKLIVNVFVTVFNAVANTVRTAYSTIKAIVQNIRNVLSFSGLVAKVKGIFNAVKNAITSPIRAAVNLVRAAIEKIKSILSTKLSLPHIKLPHFKISGSFSLNPPSVPSIGVEWYKQGGIFTKPTIAGLGEAGPEGIIPLDILWQKLDAIAAATSTDQIANAIGTGLAIQASGATMPSTINLVVELDGTKVGQKIVNIYDYTKKALGNGSH